MIRFYITCPDVLTIKGKKRADLENWIAVQGVLHWLPAEDREKVLRIYRTDPNLLKAVHKYCLETGESKEQIWVLISAVSAKIARRRGLI
jgi:hypothetical protein